MQQKALKADLWGSMSTSDGQNFNFKCRQTFRDYEFIVSMFNTKQALQFSHVKNANCICEGATDEKRRQTCSLPYREGGRLITFERVTQVRICCTCPSWCASFSVQAQFVLDNHLRAVQHSFLFNSVLLQNMIYFALVGKTQLILLFLFETGENVVTLTDARKNKTTNPKTLISC